MRLWTVLLVGSLGFVGTGCDDSPGLTDAGGETSDASSADAGPPPFVDAGPDRDAGQSTDAGAMDASDAPAACTTFDDAERGRVAAVALDELSGLAASRVRDGVLYANNDSGDSARIFVLGTDASDLGTVTLTGASHRDYEDIAVGPGPDGESWVYVGDVGDNNARTGSGSPRSEIVVYRFPEPDVDPMGGAVTRAATPEALTFTYPGSPHDCESLAVDPVSGDLYLLSKEESGPSTLYVSRAPLTSGVLTELTTVTFPSGVARATGMDVSPAGGALLVRTYNRVHLYQREGAETWVDALGRSPLRAADRAEIQGEAVGWRRDGLAYFTASEGNSPPLFEFTGVQPCAAR